jgi:hypothetical protein
MGEMGEMGEILQDKQVWLNGRLTFIAFTMGDETDAAGIMLIGGVPQAVLQTCLDKQPNHLCLTLKSPK